MLLSIDGGGPKRAWFQMDTTDRGKQKPLRDKGLGRRVESDGKRGRKSISGLG